METFQKNLELLQDSNILPNLDYPYEYEIYDMAPDIGFKVQQWCLKLSTNKEFEIVERRDLPQQKSGIMRASGHILFQTAIEAFEKCSHDTKISPANYLVLKLLRISSRLKTWLFFFWYNLCFLLRIRSSMAMLNSKKMPKDKEFRENFHKIYRVLCKNNVIPNPEKLMNYKIMYFIAEEWRHSGIVICGEKHSFVLELSYYEFQNGIFNCPKIRYIPSYDCLNLSPPCTVYKSADNLVDLAIDTVANMNEYNILKNNCQNFVHNFLHDLRVEHLMEKLEGKEICKIMDQLVSDGRWKYIIYILLRLLYVFYDQIPTVFLPYANSFVIVSTLLLLLLVTYSYLYRNDKIFKHLIPLISLIVILYLYSMKNAVIFHGFFLMLCLFTVRVLRLKPLYIFFYFLLLAPCLGFVTYGCLSVPFLPSVAIAAYTAVFGAWSAVGNTYDCDLTVILPCIILIISYYPLFWIDYAVLYFILLKKYSNTSFFEYVMLVINLLIRDFCIINSNGYTHSTHLMLAFLMLAYLIVKNAYKYTPNLKLGKVYFQYQNYAYS